MPSAQVAAVFGVWKPNAATRDEAVQRLRELIDDRLDAGAEVFELEIRGREHPLARFAGMLKDDPLLQPWKDAMAEYRRETENLWKGQ